MFGTNDGKKGVGRFCVHEIKNLVSVTAAGEGWMERERK